MTNIFVSATTTYNGKALAKGQKQLTDYEKSLKQLGKTLGSVFAAQKIYAFGKSSAQAFISDEKAAKALEIQLKNLGYGYADKSVEDYIAKLEKMYGVLDDQLRPAFQTLITSSGSLIQSQKALGIALDVSAATGKSVEEVSTALAKGYTGQTTAISRLGVGIDKTTLASGDMNKILDAIQKKFSGQAAARLGTYAGKMDLLNGSLSRSKEIIGKGILAGLSEGTNAEGLKTFTKDMENLAGVVATLVAGFASLISKVSRFTAIRIGNTNVLDKLLSIAPVVSAYYNMGKQALGTDTGARANRSYQGGQTSNDYYVSRKKELDILKENNRIAAQLLAKQKAELALKDLANKFDVERINLQTALAAATDEETKLRIKAKLALLDQDSALAALYNKQLDAANAANTFANAAVQAADKLFNAFENASNYGAFRESPYVPGAAVASASTGSVTVINNFNAPTFDTQQKINQMVQQATLENNVSLGITAPAGFL